MLSLFQANPCKHPVFYMNDVKFDILKSILEYMYLGEVHISNDNLKEFIRVAEGLKIRGLTKGGGKETFTPPTVNNAAPASHTTTTNHNNHVSPMEHFEEFDSDLSQQSGPNAESTKRIKMSDCFEAISGHTNDQQHNHQAAQQQQHQHHQPSHQQQIVHHSHHHVAHLHPQHHPNVHEQPLTASATNNKRSDQATTTTTTNSNKIQSLEPKVEMVEFMESQSVAAAVAVSVQHAAPPPAYCPIQSSLVIATGGEKATLTLDTSMMEESKLQVQQQHLQAAAQQHLQQQQSHQQMHGQNNASAANAAAWMDQKGVTEQQQQSALDAQVIQEAASGTNNVSGGADNKSATKPAKKQANCLNPHPCPVCARLYSNVSNLRQHMRLIHNRTEVCCPLCQKNFNSQLYLKRHYTSVHGYPNGSLSTTADGSVAGGGGGGGGSRRSEDSKGGSSSNNNNNNNNNSGQTNGTHGNSGWNLYEMDNSSSGNMCQ